uniref:Putative GIY-YIG homing endonuclease n=1 Tax=Bracteacoccus giganteus TaxID=50039 RepID=A0A0S2LQM8_9CHLO|nr:putative GIY-YIG homing endonuclease [Bracteacoccus giganteus]ALO63562.1 putative GIY-YIG homing endonuclease [Bracteacoccus giganteus]
MTIHESFIKSTKIMCNFSIFFYLGKIFWSFISSSFSSFSNISSYFVFVTKMLSNIDKKSTRNNNEFFKIVSSEDTSDDTLPKTRNSDSVVDDISSAVKWDITDTRYPGIYEIYDVQNKMSYYGETFCLCSRYDHHLRDLEAGTHHNKSLLNAYKKQSNPDGFRFFVLYYGDEWADKNKRLQRQNECISSNFENCYNITEISETRSIKPVMVNGTRYASIREAARQTGISRSQLIRLLNSQTNPEIHYLVHQAQEYGYIPIFGRKNDGPSVLFESYAECVVAGYATNTQNARRKIQRNETGWRYAHFSPDGTPARTPYTLKPGKISYKQYILFEQSEIKSTTS